jgi:5-formyltetrahydrofolate cyclo-ligase
MSLSATTITEAKRALRARMRAARETIGSAERQRTAEALAVAAPTIARLIPNGPIAGFWPVKGEIDPRLLMQALARLGAELALPVTARPTLLFRRWQPGDRLVPAAFGLLEPEASAPKLLPATLLVPLLAFDRQGGRLGYGAGHYDTLIPHLRALCHLTTIGLAFAGQEVAEVPCEPHDQRLDYILTVSAFITCQPAPPRG